MQGEFDELKKAAGEKAAACIEDGMVVGLGSGSTIYWMLKRLGERIKDGLEVRGIPTSIRTENWAQEFGIRLTDFSSIKKIDLAIDGADEIDANFALIKGGGGSLVREKIVDAFAERLIIIADETKKVSVLGNFPLPVEVLPFGWEVTARYISELGGLPELRMKEGKPFVSDNSNYILDCKFDSITDPKRLHQKLKLLVGVVETGLFVGMTDTVIIGSKDGINVLEK